MQLPYLHNLTISMALRTRCINISQATRRNIVCPLFYLISLTGFGSMVASYKGLTDKNNSDTFVEEESKKLDTKTRAEINGILKRALEYLVPKDRSYIADYYNLMMRDFAPVFIPFDLSKKLANLGRIEVTLLVAFDDREHRRYNEQKQQSSRKK